MIKLFFWALVYWVGAKAHGATSLTKISIWLIFYSEQNGLFTVYHRIKHLATIWIFY